jgi:hypothetical protein
MALSLRQLLGTLGISGRGVSARDQRPLELIGSSSKAKLTSAILQHLPVQFHYRPVDEDGRTGRRIGVPYAIFSKNGKRYLHLYTEPGSVTATGGLAAWRTFRLDRISNVSLPRGDRASMILLGSRTAPGFHRGWYRTAVTPIVVRPVQSKRER